MLARRFTRFISTSSSLRQQLSVSSESDLNILLGKIQLPQVDRLNEFNTQNKGLPGIFSQSTLNDIWYDQLNHKLEDIKYIFQSLSHHDYSHCFNDSSLNENTSNKVINQYKNLLSDIAKRFDPNESYLFDSTASIYNLYYFLSSLKSSTSPIPTLAKPDSLITFKPSFKSSPLNSDLVKLINKSFGSIEEFQTLLFHSAASIKGNGYTWLTYNHIDASTNDFNKLSHLSILNTYNSGIPLNFTNRRISNGREHDKRVSGESETNSSIPNLEDAKFNNVNEFQITPLFAIGSNPSFWLRDYGVFGKKQYVNNVINAIDWEIVENRLPSK